MSNHNLFTLRADGAVVPASSETILIAARQVLAHRVRRGASLQSPQKTGEYLMARLGHLDYEVFGLILLDKRHRVIECIDLFRGTIDGVGSSSRGCQGSAQTERGGCDPGAPAPERRSRTVPG